MALFKKRTSPSYEDLHDGFHDISKGYDQSVNGMLGQALTFYVHGFVVVVAVVVVVVVF